MRNTLVLGFDCGGTQTRAMLATGDGLVLGVGRAGPSNVNSLGLEAVMTQLRMAASDAWSQTDQSMRPVDAAFLGMAGIVASGQKENLQKGLCDAGVASHGCCLAHNDAEPALAGGLAGRPGIVLIAGTGSFCQGRDASGKMAHCGGWGWLLDDVGSGFYLGREALKAVVQAVDGRGEDTSLVARILAQAGLSSADALPKWLYASPPYSSFCASLAKIVTEEAVAGDAVAKQILCDGAAGLADLVRLVARRLTWEQGVEVVIVGGVGRSGMPYQPLIESAIFSALQDVRVTPPELPPVAGSVLRALELAGVPASSGVNANLRDGCVRQGLC